MVLLIIGIDQRPDLKFRQGFIGVPAAAVGARTSYRVPCLLANQEAVEGRGVLRGYLRWSAYPFGSGVCRGHVQYPAFASNLLLLLLALQKWQLGAFGLFVSCCP